VIYLCSGAREELTRVLVRMNVGLMETPASHRPRQRARFPFWAADNGCYSRGEGFDLGGYLRWLDAQDRAGCLFAVAPDVVADAQATWERSASVLPVLRGLGYGAALVAQDGMERMEVDWDAFDCLFVGGSTQWKLAPVAEGIALEAKRRGKWLHAGRVNTWKRMRHFARIGADSVDGTMLKFGLDRNFIELCRNMTRLQQQPFLPLWGEGGA
jgi:GNAT superfamily N-acetyltransferase